MGATGPRDPDSRLAWVSHQRSGISFETPSAWVVGSGGFDVVVALEPPRPSRRGLTTAPFRANLVLTVSDSGGLTFPRWQAATDRALPVLLRDYSLIDQEHVTFGGRPGGRRVARHRSGYGVRLVLQQWCCLNEHTAITLSATTDHLSHHLLGGTMRRAAGSLRLP